MIDTSGTGSDSQTALLALVAGLLQHSPDAQVVVDRDRLIRGWNAAAERLLGYSAAEAIGRSVEILAPAPDRQASEAVRLDQALNGVAVPPHDTIVVRNGGATVAVSVCQTALTAPNAPAMTPFGVLLTMRDNTARQAADALALDREFRLRAIVDHSPSALSLKTVDGRYALANPNLQRIHHLSESEIIGKTDFDLYPAEIARAFRDNDARVVRTATRQTIEEFVPVDGQLRTYTSHMFPIVDSASAIRFICRISLDATDRVNAQRDLAASEARYRGLFENMNAGFVLFEVVLDDRGAPADLLIVAANSGFETATGLKRKDTVGRRLKDSVPGIENDPANWLAIYTEVAITGRPRSFEQRSELLGVDFSVSAFQPAPLQCAVTFVDITERRAAQAQARLWMEAFARSDLGFAISDVRTDLLVDVNRAFAERRGYTVDEMRGMPVAKLFAPGSVPAFHDTNLGVDRKAHVVFESEHVCKDGSTFPVWVDLTVIADDRGLATTRVACAVDLTQRHKAEAEMRIAAIAFETQDGILVTSPEGDIERVNEAFTLITGYSSAEAVGRKPNLLRSENQDELFYEDMWRQLREQGSWRGQLVNRHRDGHLYVVRLAITAVKDKSGALRHYVGTMVDISAEQAAKDRAEHLTHFDPLTELPNRVLLEDRITHALSVRRRSNEHCALLQIDLDNFKRINDVDGHHIGDFVLVEVARRLRLLVRESDTVGRFNGDTFVVLAEELGPDPVHAAHTAGAIAEKIRRSLAQPLKVASTSIRCTASIGVTLADHDDIDVHGILQEAEIALYRAKRDGRDRVCMFEPAMQRDLVARTRLEEALDAAVESEQFVLHYQLQARDSGLPVGVEALVRWNHPERGLVFPDDFIAVAEETGQIDAIGQWVLDEACRQLRDWATGAATRDLSIAVNVSPKQLKAPDFAARVLDALARHRAEPSRLKLEITEGAVMDDVEDAIVKLDAVRRHGVKVSLDDFGTGNSSFAYLTRLPLDQIKIDRSFIVNVTDSSRDAMTAKAIVSLGRELGIEVIAEGVETSAQAAFLRDIGCDLCQGYHFARPAPLAEVERRLRSKEASK